MVRFPIIILSILLLTSCSTSPPQATSIEDYCTSVVVESNVYRHAKDQGVDLQDLLGYIRITNGKYYPPREVKAMEKVIKLVYFGATSSEIYQYCLTSRKEGTWFND